MEREYDFGPFKLIFDDEKGEAFAYKKLDPELIHDYVHDEEGYEYEEDLFGEEE